MGRGPRRGRPAACLVLAAAAGCVNNYVLVETEAGDGEGGATMGEDGNTDCVDPACLTTTTADDADATSGDASSSSSGNGTGGGDPSEAGDPSGDSSGDPSTTNDPGPGICEACEGDAECSADAAFCAPVGEANLCLRPCTEQEPPCAGEFTCENVQSVDGEMAALCVPVGKCPVGEGTG